MVKELYYIDQDGDHMMVSKGDMGIGRAIVLALTDLIRRKKQFYFEDVHSWESDGDIWLDFGNGAEKYVLSDEKWKRNDDDFCELCRIDLDEDAEESEEPNYAEQD